ncbi:MAG: DUF2634 domain-containing protein [Clostridium sp.]|jgi:hypothetical protein|nr:DUF2634 domain-containing protein [Clostridium sp.]
MTPNVGNQLKADWTIQTQPSKTYRLNVDTQTIVGFCDDRKAIEQAIYLILNTERFEWVIYSWNYGSELQGLFGKPIPYVVSEIQRRIKEALLQDDRINGIENFIVTRNGNKLLVSFDVSTIKGVISVSKEVVV